MTDAHCHVSANDPAVREFLIGRDFFGVHPWDAGRVDEAGALAELEARLEAEPLAGVGEIGLDRLAGREVTAEMRRLFEAQLALAVKLGRPVVLHGAKCWGQVVEAVRRLSGGATGAGPFLYHGFSRSGGLVPEIVALKGYISVGPAILNDHAVNYRELAKALPSERLLVETDRTEENAAECPTAREVLEKLAELRGVGADELERETDANAEAFFGGKRPTNH